MARATIYLRPGQVMIHVAEVAGAMADAMFPPPDRDCPPDAVFDQNAVKRLELERSLADDVRRQFRGRETLSIREAEEFMQRHEFSLNVAHTTDKPLPDMTSWAIWRKVLLNHWTKITEHYGKSPNARQAIEWAVRHGPTNVFIRDQTVTDSFEWIDLDGGQQTTEVKTVQNAVSDWKKKGFI